MQSMDFSHKKNKLSIIQRAKFKGGGVQAYNFGMS